MNAEVTLNGKPATMGELRAFVLRRDGMCLAQRFFRDHRCAGVWSGRPFRPTDLTLEHVTQVHSHLEGRVDNERHCVALCYSANVSVPSHELREKCRDHLRSLYPQCRVDLPG